MRGAKPTVKWAARRSVLVQRLYRWHASRKQVDAYPDWASILERDPELWSSARRKAESGPKVLIASGVGGLPTVAIMDSLLSVAMTLRGADVHVLLCDSFLPACLMCEKGLTSVREFERHGPSKYFCGTCADISVNTLSKLGITLHRYSENVTTEELARADALSRSVPAGEIETYVLDGIPIGEHVRAGALRFFARGSLEGLAGGEQVLRRYFKAAILTVYALRRLLAANDFGSVCCINAIYVPQGIVAEVARNQGTRVVAWNVAYRKRSFIFSHTDTYHHTLMNEPAASWDSIPWTPEIESETVKYLESRRRGGRDWIVFQSQKSSDKVNGNLPGFDPSRPTVGLLTNVIWDAQLHYPANVFPTMVEWLLKTIEYFKTRPDLQLVIRVHPAEVSGDIPSRQPVMKEIAKAFPTLPPNVLVVPPDSHLSTYTLMEACNAVLIYGTKTGVELTSRGIPVIVAGEAWIRGKGVTIDARTTEHYFEILDSLPFKERMTREMIERARKYAFHFFFRRMIPVTQVVPTGGEPQFRVGVERLGELMPGRSPGLDIICDGIMHGGEFVYPAERLGVSSD